MNKKDIKKALEDALLHDGEMRFDLYEFELEEMHDDLEESLHEDNDDYIFAVTVNQRREDYFCAMVVIEKSGEVYINEAARDKMKQAWKTKYASNMKKLLPSFVQQLSDGAIPINGVKTVLQA